MNRLVTPSERVAPSAWTYGGNAAYPASTAPAYPLDLLKKNVEGMVRVRYVVDTTGFADPASLEIVESTHPEFVASVRDVLPYMRFPPARIGEHKVRQLVEQPFTFRILTPAVRK